MDQSDSMFPEDKQPDSSMPMGGNRKTIDPEIMREVGRRRAAGETTASLAEEFGVAQSSVLRWGRRVAEGLDPSKRATRGMNPRNAPTKPAHQYAEPVLARSGPNLSGSMLNDYAKMKEQLADMTDDRDLWRRVAEKLMLEKS